MNPGDNDPELVTRPVRSASVGDANVYVMVTLAAPALVLTEAEVKAQDPER